MIQNFRRNPGKNVSNYKEGIPPLSPPFSATWLRDPDNGQNEREHLYPLILSETASNELTRNGLYIDTISS